MKTTRRAALGVPLMTAAALVLTAGPATAANGDLSVNDKTYTNPSGCFLLDWPRSVIDNLTDEDVEIHDTADCSEPSLEVIEAGDDTLSTDAQSIYVP
ncbi:hypothetical protein [Streptomyces sp. FH025]|uniref:hypothetical protein n=1 Tax=Streptomyces sp. FH025 TaxID=2815937 RepID=UPI001A9CCB6B|nr:hypothetical protein [Streptomyces sp. FH025]MBO1416835.1 hypothetical protein [Streptomyces sp. FH025]